MSTTGTESLRQRLEAFRRALRLEASSIAADPALLWQQVSNRLRGYDALAGKLADETDRRLHAGGPPWFRILSPLAESPQLLGSIPAHGDIAFLDGSRLVTLDAGTLTVRDGPTGMPTAVVGLPEAAGAHGLAVDGTGTVAVVDTPHGLRVHDVGTGALVSRLEGSDEPAGGVDRFDAGPALEPGISSGRSGRGFCLSPDGSMVAGIHRTGTVALWDVATGQVRRTLPWVDTRLAACAFSPDARTVVLATRDGAVRAWRHGSVADAVVLESAGPPATVLDCAVAPDGTFAVAVTSERVTVWDLPTGDRRWSLEHFGSGRCCTVSPDGLTVLTGGERGVLRLWDASTGAVTGTLAGHSGTVERCAFSRDGSLIASVADDGTRLWEGTVDGGSEYFDSHAGRVTALAFSPDGTRVASSAADRRVLLWESAGRDLVGEISGHDDAVQDCAFAGNAQVVTAGRDHTCRLWDVETGEERQRLAGGIDPWWGCAVSPDDQQALLCGTDSLVRVALPSGSPLATYRRGEETWRARYAPDGTWAVVTGAGGRVTFWDPATERGEDVTGHEGLVGACAVSPDGRFAVTGGEDGTVRIWDASTRKERLVLHHDAAVWGCAVTADARHVVSTSWDRTVRVWDVRDGRELMRLSRAVMPHGCATHPWRTQVAFGDVDGRVHLVEPMGLAQGEITVTARDEDGVLRARCPACATVRDLEQPDLGSAYTCPCGLPTRVAGRALRVTRAPVEPEDRTEGLARALGAVTPRERTLMFSTKTCVACGAELELLRHKCPRCGSAMASPPDVEAAEFMQMRQSRATDLVNRATLRFRAGDVEEAEALFREAVEVNPWNATACGNLGVVLARRGETAEALTWVEKAVGIDPQVPGGRQMLDRLRREVGRPRAQPEEATQVTADAEVEEARAAMNAQQWESAISHWGRAIDRVEQGHSCSFPTHMLYGERATAHAYRGDYRSSVGDLGRALALNPHDWRYLDARGRAHFTLRRFPEAMADYTGALEQLGTTTGDTAAGILLYRAATYRQLDRPHDALDDLVRADAACTNPAIRKGIEDLRRTILSEEGLG